MNPKDRRFGSNLVALGTAAVMTVYGAGFLRTRSAAQRFAGDDAERRPAAPAAATPSAAAAPSPDVRDSERSVSPAPSAEVSAPSIQHSSFTPAPAPLRSVDRAQSTARTTDSVAGPAVVASTPPTVPPAADSSSRTATPSAPDSASQQKDKARPAWADGTYTGYGTSRHGDIEASVRIANGRITSAWISQCLTRYSCSWISALPGQVVSRQSAEVDYVSGATQSSNAFYYAVVEALTKAK